MVYFNVLYKNDKEDVEIISAPDYIAIEMFFTAKFFRLVRRYNGD